MTPRQATTGQVALAPDTSVDCVQDTLRSAGGTGALAISWVIPAQELSLTAGTRAQLFGYPVAADGEVLTGSAAWGYSATPEGVIGSGTIPATRHSKPSLDSFVQISAQPILPRE